MTVRRQPIYISNRFRRDTFSNLAPSFKRSCLAKIVTTATLNLLTKALSSAGGVASAVR